jgi:hypothetical protein
MICCFAKDHDVEINDRGYKFQIKKPEDEDKLKGSEIFVTTHTLAVHHKGFVQGLALNPDFPLPPLLTREFIESPPLKPKIRMVAHNGLGGGIGDCIAGLDAFSRLHEEFWKRGRHLEIDILCQDGKWVWADRVYMFAPYINGIIPGGMLLPDYCNYDVRIDTEGYTDDMDASGMNMYDYVCTRVCVDPTGPHRPEWLLAETAIREVRKAVEDIPRPRMVLNFFASSFRSIPKSHRRKLVEGYAKQGYNVIVVASEKDAEEARWAMKVKHKHRSRVHERLEVTSRSLHHLAALAGEVDFVSTPDTGLIHMCGLVGVPTVGVFYSIEPALRIRDFPNVAPFCPEAFRCGPHWGMHKPPLDDAYMESKELYERLARLYDNPEKVPGYKETWKEISVDEILETKPGDRIESVVRAAPLEEEGHAWRQSETTAGASERPEETPESQSESVAPTG